MIERSHVTGWAHLLDLREFEGIPLVRLADFLRSREGGGQVPFLLAEQRRGWRLMIFLCSRNARPQRDGKGSPLVLLLAERAR